ncbi:MAG: hypothetical protein ACE37N_17995, partial [Pseudohongiellaceae bacterium]
RVEAIASAVRGEREDIVDNLYRVNPDNARISLFYETPTFSAKLEQVLTDNQDRLSATNTNDPGNPNNSFLPTGGYSLTNLYLTWLVSDNMTIAAGAENIFDRDYVDHLSGFNRVSNSVVPQGSRMFGQGQNVFGRLQYEW